MELKKTLSDFSDRDLLELILLNQVHFDRRLERMETHFRKSYDTGEYDTAPYKLDGRQNGYSASRTFEELVRKSQSTKNMINQFLKEDNAEISW